jgi:amino-acid N-acetyltransferase
VCAAVVLGYSPTGEIFNLSVETSPLLAAIDLGMSKLLLFGAESGLLTEQAGAELRPQQIPQHLRRLNGSYRAELDAARAGLQRRRCGTNIVSYTEMALCSVERRTKNIQRHH